MTDKELERITFRDVYNFLKKNSDVRTSDEYWENLITESSQIINKNNSKLCKDMLYVVVNYLEDKYKRLNH